MAYEPIPVPEKPETSEEYIFQGLRKDYPDLAEFDEDVIKETIKEAYFKDIDDDVFLESLHEAYVPTEVTKKEKTAKVWKDFGDSMKTIPGEVWKSYTSPFRMIDAVKAGKIHESSLNKMEEIGYQDLLNRGYSPEIAQHVMRQRVETQNELSNELAATAEEVKGQFAEAVGTYAGSALWGGVEAKLAGTSLAPILKHVISGAGGLGTYEALKATAEGAPASEIMTNSMVGGVIGAGLGPILGPLGTRVGKALGKTTGFMGGSIQRYIERPATEAARRAKEAAAAQSENFSRKFNPDWLRTRFSDLPVVMEESTPAEVVAASIMQRVLGQDVAENAAESTVARIAEKIRNYRLYNRIDPSGQRFQPPKLVGGYLQGYKAPGATDPIKQMDDLVGLTPEVAHSMVSPREALDAVIEAGRMQNQMGQSQQYGGMVEPNVLGAGQSINKTSSGVHTGEQGFPPLGPETMPTQPVQSHGVSRAMGLPFPGPEPNILNILPKVSAVADQTKAAAPPKVPDLRTHVFGRSARKK